VCVCIYKENENSLKLSALLFFKDKSLSWGGDTSSYQQASSKHFIHEQGSLQQGHRGASPTLRPLSLPVSLSPCGGKPYFWEGLLHLHPDSPSAAGLSAADASQHRVTLAAAAAVNVGFPSSTTAGFDNARPSWQELNLEPNEQNGESVVLLIWFGCRMFSSFHTQVILRFFSFFLRAKADYTVARRVNSTLQVYVSVHAPVRLHIFGSSDTASNRERYVYVLSDRRATAGLLEFGSLWLFHFGTLVCFVCRRQCGHLFILVGNLWFRVCEIATLMQCHWRQLDHVPTCSLWKIVLEYFYNPGSQNVVLFWA